MEEQGTSKKGRGENFTPEEEVALANAIKDREEMLFGRFRSTAITKANKFKAWMEVRDAVNAVGGNNRLLTTIRTKHKNMKSATKRIESTNRKEMKKTGGGRAPIIPLSESQSIILQTIPEASITGIEGGIDLHEDTGKYV